MIFPKASKTCKSPKIIGSLKEMCSWSRVGFGDNQPLVPRTIFVGLEILLELLMLQIKQRLAHFLV
jgi:hypothetical protein